MTCADHVFRNLGHVLGLDYVRTRWFLFQLRRLLKKNGYTAEEIRDVVAFALAVRHLEPMA